MAIEFSAEQRRALMGAARASIRTALAGTWAPDGPASDDPALLQPSGCFVTLHERGTHRLRGCIGRMQAEGPLIRTVHATAAGALEDPRFGDDRVTTGELPRLEMDISVLSPMAPAANTLDFDLLNDGILLTFGTRSGVFLPQVARETGWSKEQLLGRLCSEKMGLSPYVWQNPHARLMKFTSTIVGPEAFDADLAPPAGNV